MAHYRLRYQVNIGKQYMKGMVKVYFGILKIQV